MAEHSQTNNIWGYGGGRCSGAFGYVVNYVVRKKASFLCLFFHLSLYVPSAFGPVLSINPADTCEYNNAHNSKLDMKEFFFHKAYWTRNNDAWLLARTLMVGRRRGRGGGRGGWGVTGISFDQSRCNANKLRLYCFACGPNHCELPSHTN